MASHPLRHPPRHAPQVALITGLCSLGLIAMIAAALAWSPDVEGVRMTIRATARTSLVFFLLAYSASALHALWPSDASRWIRTYRRQWGWLLVISHTLHAAGILAFSQMAPEQFQPPMSTWITGGLAYLVLWSMGATSFDRTAAWLGREAWARLHTWGSHYIWVSFVLSNAKRIGDQPVYLLPTLLLMGVILMRLLAAWRARPERSILT